MAVKRFLGAVLFAIAVCHAQENQPVQNTPLPQADVTMTRSEAAKAGFYEDEQIRVRIPPGWVLVTGERPWVGSYDAVCGSDIIQAHRKLLLTKNGYTLAIAYDTSHATNSGTFTEVLRIPWLENDCNLADVCGPSLRTTPQPVNRRLMFMNLSVDGKNSNMKRCGVPESVGFRWFAGYFTADGDWFFNSEGKGCGLKAYTLTSSARTPDKLPAWGDPSLKRITKEAIDIVASIRYKRCPPASSTNFSP